jgi:superfamily II DNA or RNA helicase
MDIPPLQLRPYQLEALRISKKKWEEGITRQLLALPTGTGKTCILASLLEHHKFLGNMLVLVHRSELAIQTYKKIQAWNPDLPLAKLGVEMGLARCTGWEKVVIAGVQAVGRADSLRLLKFRPGSFDVIVCDEAHHSVTPTYRNVFDHFGLFVPKNKKLLLGVTATPYRADDRTLVPDIYEEVIYNMPLLQAIEAGWLCDVRGFSIRTMENLDSVVLGDDDFVLDQLSEQINNPSRNGLIAREWARLAPNRKTLVFAVTISHAMQLAAAFSEYCHVEAAYVWGGDPDRKAKIEEHKKGSLQVLCNCQVLTEGYDDWGIECIVMARPTLSKVLFVQMVGRGTRIEDELSKRHLNLNQARENGFPISKTDCMIIDVVDNCKKHDLVTLASLYNRGVDLGGKSLTEAAKMTQPVAITGQYLNPTDLQKIDSIKTHTEEVDLFRGARKPKKPTKPSEFEIFREKWERAKREGHYWYVVSAQGGSRIGRWRLEASSPTEGTAHRESRLLGAKHPDRFYEVLSRDKVLEALKEQLPEDFDEDQHPPNARA